MRIRKHAQKILTASSTTTTATATHLIDNNNTCSSSSIIPSPPVSCERVDNLQLHVCELNRSPWDVISFTSQSELYYPDDYKAMLRDDIMVDNTIEQGSVNAFQSSEERILSEEEEEEDEEEVDEEENRYSLLADVDEVKRKKIGKREKVNIGKIKREIKEEKEKKERLILCCNKTDGKGWKCRRKAKEGHSLCEHHLIQLRNYHITNTNNQVATKKSDNIKPVVSSIVSGRRRNKGKAASSTPADYYYYSGFGPLWGKKRRGSSEVVKKDEREIHEAVAYQNQIQTQRTRIQNTPSHMDVDDDDNDVMYIDDDDDDDEYDDINGVDVKKRIRKPIKARSLKSLL